jgi:hypothetical protein
MNPPKRNPNTISRRTFIASLGLGGLSVASVNSNAFTTGNLTRSSTIDTAEDSQGLIGLNFVESIQRKDTDVSFVTITNNSTYMYNYTLSITGDASQVVSFTNSGNSELTLSLAPTSTITVTVDVANKNSSISTVPLTISGEAPNAPQFTISRDTVGYGAAVPTDNSIALTNTGEKGNSGQFTLEWITNTQTGQTVTLYVNGTERESGLPLNSSTKLKLTAGDTVRVDVVDTNGTVVQSDSLTI